MSAANRIPIDPDLERALVELRGTAVRLRQVDEDLITHGAEPYTTYAHRIVLLNDCRRAIAGRAKIMSLKAGSLLLFIEEFDRLRKKTGRKPNLAQLQRSVEVAQVTRARDLSTRKAEEAIAAFTAEQAQAANDDCSDATRYLEACAS